MQSIRLLREVFGINQQTLVERSGLSRKSVSHYETGREFPTRLVCKRLDDAIVAIIDERAFESAQKLRYERVPEQFVALPGSGEPPPKIVGDNRMTDGSADEPTSVAAQAATSEG